VGGRDIPKFESGDVAGLLFRALIFEGVERLELTKRRLDVATSGLALNLP
jgi:hypothetical protein